MLLAVWLGEDGKCSVAVVGLDIHGTALFMKSVF